jgi:hypothetical protein
MKNNSNYSDAKTRLAYVWQALKDGSKFNGSKAGGVPFRDLQANLKETLIQQLASAETNYSQEGKSYSGAGRSCPGGTKNIIMQVLDDYHDDVDFGYAFKGNFAPKLQSGLVESKFKELLLEELAKLSLKNRSKIVLSWNASVSISDQVQLDLENRSLLVGAIGNAEKRLLEEYKNSQFLWHNKFRKDVVQSLSINKASMLKPEIDLVYEYKQFLASKNFSYAAMKQAITDGKKVSYREFDRWLNSRELSSPLITHQMLNMLIPTITTKRPLHNVLS